MKQVIDTLRANRERALAEVIELVRIPSISPGLPHPEAITEAADWLERRLERAGMNEVRQLKIESLNPVVWARKHISDDLPTILFYGHYDVMPADPLDEWASPPFEPEVRDGKIFGRGTADDKGQVMMHINAVEATLQATGTLPVNVIFAIEGEEEEGSEALELLLDSQRDLLAADVAVISDSPFFAAGCPSVCSGLRGIATAEIRVDGPATDLHSGNYGGAIANPAEFLARILSDLKDRDGRIAIDGFYDDVLELSPGERDGFASLPFDEQAFYRDLGAEAPYGEAGFSTLERIWARPSLEVNGLSGGFAGEGSKTIVPARATAKISMRLVPNQEPDRILDLLERHIRSIAPPEVRVSVSRGHGGRPFLAPIDNPHVRAAFKAMELAFEGDVHSIRDGASIPIVASLSSKLGATCLLLGVDVPEGRIHGPNEMLIVDHFHRGAEMIAHLIELI
jgi:acetylornithine deacetylase/succinyl-diaminopimelate desuccinylase-like protein